MHEICMQYLLPTKKLSSEWRLAKKCNSEKAGNFLENEIKTARVQLQFSHQEFLAVFLVLSGKK